MVNPTTAAAISRDAASPARALESGPPGKVFTYWRSDYLTPPAGAAAPQAFLVEMPTAGAVIPPHFHREDEFQVVVAGGGSLGKHALDGVAVHFADAYTPYGPIRVGAGGLTFFTLRARADAGARYMPEERAGLIRKARRSLAAGVPSGARAGDSGEPVALWPPHDDGLAAWAVRARPGAPVEHPAGDGGRYYLIVDGALVLDATALPRWSCVWAEAGAARPALCGGSEGGEILVVQFPRSAAASAGPALA